jgi:putative transposase
MLIRTYKYLLRPTPEQERSLELLLWQSRNVYNMALEQRITTYRETKHGISYKEQWEHFREVRHAEMDTLGKLNASSVQQLLRRLDKSFSAFFRRLKTGETPGFPRFKNKDRFKSIEYTYGDGCKLRVNEHGRYSFYVQNVGEMRMCYHRSIPENSNIKHVILKYINHRWYVCLMLEIMQEQVDSKHSEKIIGIDVGLKSLLAFSDGTLIDNPRLLRESLIELRIKQRHASRQKKGSKNQRKTYFQIAKLHEKISNQRMDYLHKVSREIVNNYGLIAFEDLSLKFMNQNRHLSLSSHDAGFGIFRQLLVYKAEEAGVQTKAVNPYNTSQRCSSCGNIVPKTLAVRVHTCPNCGLVIDRDVNAARNVLELALTSLGRSEQTVTWAVAPCVV